MCLNIKLLLFQKYSSFSVGGHLPQCSGVHQQGFSHPREVGAVSILTEASLVHANLFSLVLGQSTTMSTYWSWKFKKNMIFDQCSQTVKDNTFGSPMSLQPLFVFDFSFLFDVGGQASALWATPALWIQLLFSFLNIIIKYEMCIFDWRLINIISSTSFGWKSLLRLLNVWQTASSDSTALWTRCVLRSDTICSTTTLAPSGVSWSWPCWSNSRGATSWPLRRPTG